LIYSKVIEGTFISRPNRFIANVEVEGTFFIAHVKNTGRCKELLIPGVKVILEDFREANSSRKTQFDLIAVYKDYNLIKKQFPDAKDSIKSPLLINIDSQAPNKVVHEWLKNQNFDYIKPEFTYGNSRFDFYMERNNQKYLLEVKGCTLEVNGMGYFPDAPTERGVKHLNELAEATKNGYKCLLAFVIQMEGVSQVKPNIKTHPEFGTALASAKNAGVEVLFLQTKVSKNQLLIIDSVHI